MKASSAPKISVIMSVYNGMPYLKEAVQSILAQTYKNFEFIIVDDASTDRSWQYLKSLNDKRIKLIQNKKNLGLAKSLNITLRQAQGDFVARMDADDVSLPERLNEQLKFVTNKNIDISGTWAKLIDENGEPIRSIHKPLLDKDIKKNIWIPPIIHPTWFVKRTVFDDLKGYNAEFDGAEDFEFILRATRYKMGNLNKELLLWRTYPGRRSQKQIQRMFEMEFKAKLNHFKNSPLGYSYIPKLLYKFLTTYLIPPSIKLFIAKKLRLA